MNEKKFLNVQGALLDKYQLDLYLKKVASDHIIQNKSDIRTYPITRLKENYEVIKKTYNLLNEHIKLGIPIHPAGEWILDNFYIIEETVKNILKELSVQKYKSFVGLANEKYQGFARIYVLASEMVAYTDGKIDSNNLKEMLESYQNKKNLSMNEIWNIGLFIQIALIENIRHICEKIYVSQIQKYKVENIIERIIEKKDKLKFKINLNNSNSIKIGTIKNQQIKYSFVEYMSYKLKKYGKQAYPYLEILKEEVNKAGSNLDDVIRKEHFDIAVKKVSVGNSITTLKNISRINFLEIFEKLNRVEDILRKDPANQYSLMDAKTKIFYRNVIQEISIKTKLSEIYIANKCLQLSQNAVKNNEENSLNIKKTHIGYYLISDGKTELMNDLTNKNKKTVTKENKARLYVCLIWIPSLLVSLAFSIGLYNKLKYLNADSMTNVILSIIMFIILIIPIENIATKIIQYILSKCVKPKIIPKLDFQNGIPKEYATMVVIPTILKSKEQVKELFKKLEVYYISNKSNNLYFTLLGDCSSSPKEIEDFDNEIIEEGIAEAKKLNEKYQDIEFNKFNFIYRKRLWNEKEGCFLGWERKRGLLNQFNEFILGKIQNPFRINTIEKEGIKKLGLKYIITLDADTELPLNSGLELIGAMAHILNKPILNEKKDLVVSGHGIIAPRVGIGLDEKRKSLFTMIYAGEGGTDSYTNAVSDIYQDNFDEGIYTGKGIYDINIFEEVLNNEIKTNTVLSHDLLEGCYLRSGYASDIMLMDGCPTNYMSFKKRLARWTRGDYQIIPWLKNTIVDKNKNVKDNPLSFLSKYKILCNILRSKNVTMILALIIYSLILKFIYPIKIFEYLLIAIIAVMTPVVIDFINKIIYREYNIIKTKTFTKDIAGTKATMYRDLISLSTLPDYSYMLINAEIKTLNRMYKTKKHLLEWETSEETEKKSDKSLALYYKDMLSNIILGAIFLIISFVIKETTIGTSIFMLILGIIWLQAPLMLYTISPKIKKVKEINTISLKDKEFLIDVANRTWRYFKDNLNEKNNYLPPDNFQEDRSPIFTNRTSSTNIGLAMLAVISSYDFKFETLEDTIDLLYNMTNTISSLQKWNGHLYNWYNIETLEPLAPKYVSSVDSGNLVGYLYVVIQFLIEVREKIKLYNKENTNEKVNRSIVKEKNIGNEQTILKIDFMIEVIKNLISNSDFSKLYSEKNSLFSVGYNVEENKLTDAYYDLLASEARQISIVAIAKKDINSKHWFNLSRTLTSLDNYKGLLSWAGTAFEYLMPNINIPQYPGSILDESCKFLVMSQKKYANKLGVPWGFSEAAFNLKDLNNNYQYKAFGIPWLGLKRGLADEIVVSSYGSILAITENTKSVLKNLKKLKEQGMYNKYGFYESIDYTPSRVKETNEVVKTYMAHHQGLILLSLNNLFNDFIFQRRFMQNPEMQSIKILLQEKMPENIIITKEEKEKIEKIKYIDYEDYNQRKYNKIDEDLNISNVISNDKYTIVMDQYGNGYSKFNDIQINRYKNTDDEQQGIIFFIKDVKNKRIWTNIYSKYLSKPDKYSISFFPDMSKISRVDGCIETTTEIITDTNAPVEIRRVKLSNTGTMNETIEITSFIEPILSTNIQDYTHKAFNNLFITYEYLDNINVIIAKRNKRMPSEKDIYLGAKLYVEGENDSDMEYEIDKEKFYGRCNINIPQEVENSSPFSRKTERVTNPIIALKKIISIPPNESVYLNLLLSISNDKEEMIKNIAKFTNNETIKQTFKLSKARLEAETRYLGIKGKNIEVYQRLLSYLLFTKKKIVNIPINMNVAYPNSGLWKYGVSGDLPILLVKIKNINDIEVVKDAINAYEYYKSKNINLDLVILNEEQESYENYVKDAIQSIILNKNLEYLLNIKGGIYCLNSINDKQDKYLLDEKAAFIINSDNGSLETQINDFESSIKEKKIQIGYDSKNEYNLEEYAADYNNKFIDEEKLKYFNEYGGFSSNGKEYYIRTNKRNKLPTVWSHILTNEHFGTLVTESMGGYTWMDNCKLNKLTAWSNNPITDIPSEIIYLKDMENDKKWSLGLNPMPDDEDYYITYGFGFATYSHMSDEIEQKLDVFVPMQDNLKINLLHLENKKIEGRKIKLIYYIKPVLGEDEIKSNGEIYLEYNKKSNVIMLRNISNNNTYNKMFISCSEKINSFTGDKVSFLKNSTINNPDGVDQLELNRENSYGKDTIIAIEMNIKLDSVSGKDISIMMGTFENENQCKEIAYKYSNINNCKEELIKTKKYWSDLTNQVQVSTPAESMNILLNGWLIYQTITSRLYGRTGYYQSGGAFGFRDQLQDCLAIKYYAPDIVREQILKHSRHQFIEGDVEHWWHEEISRGIRTRFSDDLLWLPYITANYIEYTNDYGILEEITPYLQGDELNQNENERYDLFKVSNFKQTLYEHCIKAIEKSLKFGEHGLPLIGSGDWNDGLSNVGPKGKGESVWLGFFIYDVLRHFIPICRLKKDDARVIKYTDVMEKLKKNLNTNGWDGRWYKRAYTDNGDILGSLQNDECRIDSISQSWSVISGAGDNDKKYISMESLENHLVDKTDGLIKLLDPPFEKSKLEPGYIKSYISGTRENGGQYTHGAVWTVIAMAILGLDEKAYEYFKMINPIEHARTKEAANKYKVEPYIISADVYGIGNLAGRGGWTWYTGSASWMYVCGLKYILGINIQDGILRINPHIPQNWNNYSVSIKYGKSIYNIKVTKGDKSCNKAILNGNVIEKNEIKIDETGGIYNFEIIL